MWAEILISIRNSLCFLYLPKYLCLSIYQLVCPYLSTYFSTHPSIYVYVYIERYILMNRYIDRKTNKQMDRYEYKQLNRQRNRQIICFQKLFEEVSEIWLGVSVEFSLCSMSTLHQLTEFNIIFFFYLSLHLCLSIYRSVCLLISIYISTHSIFLSVNRQEDL